MIRSMTGFGDASDQVDQVHYSVEIRSLNNRYFKATVRLPEELSGLEAELESQLRKRLTRGSIVLVVKVKWPDNWAANTINDDVLKTYLEHLEKLHSQFNEADHQINIDLTALLGLPGVLHTEDESLDIDQARPVVMKLADEACDKLMGMREIEGKSLSNDLLAQCSFIRERLEIICQRAPLVIDEYHDRLRSRIDELMTKAQLQVEQQDLIREVAVFADRSDISEEVARLNGHLEQFEQILNAPNYEAIGRTLDFLTQEMLRESNTTASKSGDVAISRGIVEIKGAIDRLKEQVQNVE